MVTASYKSQMVASALNAREPDDVLDALARINWASTNDGAACPENAVPDIGGLIGWLPSVEESVLVATWARLKQFKPPPIDNLAIAAEFAYRGWCWQIDSGEIHGEPIAGIPVFRWVVGETGESDLAQAICSVHTLWLGDKLLTKHPLGPLVTAWQAQAATVPAMRSKREAWLLAGRCTRCGGEIDGDGKHCKRCKRKTNCRKARSVPEPAGWMLARALAAMLEVFTTGGDADSEADQRALVDALDSGDWGAVEQTARHVLRAFESVDGG